MYGWIFYKQYYEVSRLNLHVFKGDFTVFPGGNALQGIVPEFPAYMGCIHDTAAGTEHSVGIGKGLGELAVFAVFFDLFVTVFHVNPSRSHNSPVYPLYYIKNPAKNQ